MYVLNEKIYIDKLLDTYKKPDDLSIIYLATLLSKRFYGVDSLFEKVMDELSKFNITGYQEYIYADKVYNVCYEIITNSDKRQFKELEYVPVYKCDINIINTLPNDKSKKLLFTIIVNARYMNSNGWINKKTSDGIRELFKQANISCGADERDKMLHELYKNGYISFAKANMNQNIKYNYYDDNDEVAYKVVDFKYLGNQYIGNFKKGYMMCKNCGKIIKVTGNKKMYCKKCKEEKQLLWQRECMKRMRES